jgi:hypothetical protein
MRPFKQGRIVLGKCRDRILVGQHGSAGPQRRDEARRRDARSHSAQSPARRTWPAFRVPASVGMLPGHQIIHPISFAIVVSMQSDLIIPGQQRLLRVFR